MTPQAKTLRRPRTAALRRRETEVLASVDNLPPVLLILPSLRGQPPRGETAVEQPATIAPASTAADLPAGPPVAEAVTLPAPSPPESAEAMSDEASPGARAARRRALTAGEGSTQPWWNIAIGVACALAALAGAQIFLRGGGNSTAQPSGVPQASSDESLEPLQAPVVVPPATAEVPSAPLPDRETTPTVEPPVEPELPTTLAESPPAAAAPAYPATSTPREPRLAERPGEGTYPRTPAPAFEYIPPVAEPSSSGYPTTDPSTYLYRSEATPPNAQRPAAGDGFSPPLPGAARDDSQAALGAIDTRTVR